MTLGLKNLFGCNQSQQDQLNNDYFNYSPTVVQTKWIEDNHAYYLKVALPGLTEKEIDVKVDDSAFDPSNPLVTINAGIQLNQNNSFFNKNEQNSSFPNQSSQGLGNSFTSTQSFGQNFSSYQDLNTPYPITNYNQYASFANRFYLSFPVPTSRVKIDDIQASTDNGVLTVKFPKQLSAQTQGARPINLGKSRL